MPRILAILTALIVSAGVAGAHPVLKDSHDRTIVVRLQKTDAPDKIRLCVEYRLELLEWTVYENDMRPFRDEVPFNRLEPLKYYAKFAEIFAPIYADRLVARIDKGEPAKFRCLSHKETLHDENGKGLGHLRCDFVFEATLDVPADKAVKLSFREANYYLEVGQILLTLANESNRVITNKSIPDEALWKRMRDDKLEADDDERLREISFILAPARSPVPDAKVIPPKDDAPKLPEPNAVAAHHDWFDLRRLVLNTEYGFGLVLLLAFVFGAAHALTPGHGKTLVAAYLVGERGTIWHALYLGGVTTLTHTGVVMLIAFILWLLPKSQQEEVQGWLNNGLQLVMGLIIVCMGFWLLLQRLAGRADHVHLGGHDHHHHGEPSATTTERGSLGWWGITLLGITGGMIPCWDAVGVLCGTIGTGELWLVLPTVAVFSAGLALVLVAIGVVIVQMPRFVESRFGVGRVFRALPIVSAVLVTLMGLWLCYEGVHGGK